MVDFASILIVDDEEIIRDTLREMLDSPNYTCVFACNGREAQNCLEQSSFDLVITDLSMPQMDGMTLLSQMSQFPGFPTAIVLSGYAEISLALESARRGAFDYLVKPIVYEQLQLSVARALEHHRLTLLGARLARQFAQVPTYAGLLGQSAAMREVFRLIAQTAPTNATILITGESGTGKERVARAVHTHSCRCDKPFSVIDCAAIPESLIESTLFGHKAGAFTGATFESQGILGHADGGTVFFDEIGELPLALQPKLLRVLQERTYTPVGASRPVSVDVRILAATNRNLEEEVRKGRFREDLFYRLNVIEIHVPPLRERGDDAIGLARFFFAELSPSYPSINEIAPEVFEYIRRYGWPGNVRELRNIMERVMATAQNDIIGLNDLPSMIRKERSIPALNLSAQKPDPSMPLLPFDSLGNLESEINKTKRHYLSRILAFYKGNIVQAAEHAGVSRKTIYRIVNEVGLDIDGFREDSIQ